MRLLIGLCAATLAAGPIQAQPSTPTGNTEPGVTIDGGAELAAEPRDRFEGVNRAIWGFNRTVDRIVLKPVSSVYRTVIPRVARRGITQVFANLSEPWSFINNLLQGKPRRAANNLGRFVINTTIGIAGLSDRATKMGLKSTPEDFGQTLAVWGVRSSAYVVLPILGPSTVRDGVGTGVAFVADPYQICLNNCTDLSVWAKRGITAVSIVNVRANLTESGADAFLESSLDPYAAARSAFLQRREAAIANREEDEAPVEATPDANLSPEALQPDPADPSSGGTPAPDAPVTTPSGAPTPEGSAAPTATPDRAAAAAGPRLAYVF